MGKIKTYGLIDAAYCSFTKAQYEALKGGYEFHYDYIFKTSDLVEALEVVNERFHAGKDTTIEIYYVDEDGNFLGGSDFDSDINFIER